MNMTAALYAFAAGLFDKKACRVDLSCSQLSSGGVDRVIATDDGNEEAALLGSQDLLY